MAYHALGRSGLIVSEAWLGTANFGGAGCDAAEASRITAAFLDAGHNVIDVGGGGPDEKEIAGRAIRGKRDSIVLAAKVIGPDRARPMAYLSRVQMIDALDATLRSLRTDHVDLLQVLRYPDQIPIEETVATLDGFVRAGKVRYLGCCNFTAAEVVEAQWAAQRLGATPFVSLQSQYSLLARGIEPDVLPTCERHGLGVAARSPLSNGVLTGRYRAGAAPDADSRIQQMLSATAPAVRAMAAALLDRRNDDIVDELVKLASTLNISPAAVAVAWVRQRPGVTSVVIGPRLATHLDANLAGFTLDLPPDAASRLDDLSEPSGITRLNGVALTAGRR
jgi:aryl-alcohol dehydrogenase-like predicted oxidoreductase